MKEIKISVTEDKVVFTVGGEEYFVVLPRFLEVLRADGEAIKNEAERIAHRFDELKRLETVAAIDALRDAGLPLSAIAARIRFPEGLLQDFLEAEAGYLAGVRADPSYIPQYNRLRADLRLCGNVEGDRPLSQPAPPAAQPHPIRDLPWLRGR